MYFSSRFIRPQYAIYKKHCFMNRTGRLLIYLLLAMPLSCLAQNDPHYTIFMYNKLLYNPAYAGSRNVLSANATIRNQWTGIKGAPVTFSISADAPVGSYMKSFRKVAVGMSLSREKTGVEASTNAVAYYAYRIKLENSVLSFGLQGGAKFYSANYSELNPYQPADPNLKQDISNAILPNFGPGVYMSGEDFYAGVSVPNLLQNYYDKNEPKLNNTKARQIRGYYFSGGYIYPVNETIKIMPQLMARYTGNATYKLPVSYDLNLSAIAYDRLLLGFTYRSDKSLEGIVHLQATKNLNIGYAYDYMTSSLNGYSGGTHEIMLGYDFIPDQSKYSTPRFLKPF
jgi:type IX secretion system PorP/SprF family membrane protein